MQQLSGGPNEQSVLLCSRVSRAAITIDDTGAGGTISCLAYHVRGDLWDQGWEQRERRVKSDVDTNWDVGEQWEDRVMEETSRDNHEVEEPVHNAYY